LVRHAKSTFVQYLSRQLTSENKGDKNDQFEAKVNMSGFELGEENVCVAKKCGVDDCEGQFKENQKAPFDINDHECNMITDTEDNIGKIF
jgi:hypothetical protein